MDASVVALALMIGLMLGAAAALWLARGARADLTEARGQAARDAQARAAAEARLTEAVAALERHRLELAEMRDLRHRAETQAALARQEAAEMRGRIQDWEATKAEFMVSTQASVLATAQQISSKLLEDHKREAAEAKAAAELKIAETTASLQREVKTLTDGVSQLKGQIAEKSVTLDTVVRALSNPAGAGYYAEVGLANTLTGFGLTEGRDFVLQHTVYGADSERKRPDAMIFLPGDSVLVVDSKASKHLLALAEAEGTEREAESYRGLARTMNQHLKDLSDRDYRAAILAGYRKAGRSGDIVRVITVMYLPNEGAIEKLGRADPGFMVKAAEAQITPAGPAGLSAIIGFASIELSLIRQMENQSKIVEAAERLLENLTVALGHAGAIGRGIKAAADGFAKLTASVNARVLPRAREMHKLGLRPAKPIPANLPAYQVLDLGADLIEGEVTDQGDEGALPPPKA